KRRRRRSRPWARLGDDAEGPDQDKAAAQEEIDVRFRFATSPTSTGEGIFQREVLELQNEKANPKLSGGAARSMKKGVPLQAHRITCMSKCPTSHRFGIVCIRRPSGDRLDGPAISNPQEQNP